MLPSGHAAANAPLASQLAPVLCADPTRAPTPGLLFRLKWEEAAGVWEGRRKHQDGQSTKTSTLILFFNHKTSVCSILMSYVMHSFLCFSLCFSIIYRFSTSIPNHL